MTDSSVRGPDRSALGSPCLEGRPCPARPPSELGVGTNVLLTGPPTGTHPQGPGVGGHTGQAYRGSPLHFLIHGSPVIPSLHHNTHPNPCARVHVWEFLSKSYLLRNALLRASSTSLVWAKLLYRVVPQFPVLRQPDGSRHVSPSDLHPARLDGFLSPYASPHHP